MKVRVIYVRSWMMTTLQFFTDDFLVGGIFTTTDFVQIKSVHLLALSVRFESSVPTLIQ